jgi:metal-dependent amidase/aminoacylase/carboxypeptidase family protein
MSTPDGSPVYRDDISLCIDSLDDTLRPINLKIHDNPELCYEEFIAHEILVSFLKTRPGWIVTSSTYGIATAFVAEFDSGKKGPVVSFNAEYGDFTDIHCL